MSILLSFFLPSTKTNHSSLTQKGCENKYCQDLNKKLSSEKKEPQMIQICPFKKKEKEGGEGKFELNGQWKVPMLGGQWKVPMFGGQWK
jgi:hypothetical protein